MANELTEEPHVKYAGFWIRVGAALLDFLVVLIPTALHMLNLYYWKILFLEPFLFLPLIIYKPFMEMRYGATLGKMALDIKVVARNLQLMDLRQTLIRSSPWLLSGFVSIYVVIGLFTHPSYADTNGFTELAALQEQITPNVLNWISMAFMFAAVIMVASNSQKRGLHDLLAGTYCIIENEEEPQ